jgi:putative chitinase
MGNRNGTDDGWTYRGAGLVQITGKDNFRKFGLDANAAITPASAARVLFDGMIAGLFTGKKLADYDVPSGFDFVGARRIINGQAQAGKYAADAQKWLDALDGAGRSVVQPAPAPDASAPVKGSFLGWLLRMVGVRK